MMQFYHFFQALAPSPSKVARTVVSEYSYASNQEKAKEKYIKNLKDLMKYLTEKRLLSSHEYKLFSMVFPNSCLKIKYAVLD